MGVTVGVTVAEKKPAEMSAEAVQAIKDALTTLNKVADELPGRAKAAIEILANLLGYGTPKAKESLNPEEIDRVFEQLLLVLNDTEEEAEKKEDYKAPEGIQSLLSQVLTALQQVLSKLGYGNYGYPKYGPKYPYAYKKYGYEHSGYEYPVTKAPRKIKASSRLIEAVEGTEGREWAVLLIQTGLSKNRFLYPDSTLTKAVPLFEGVKSYINHPDVSERRSLPERDVKDIAGWFEGVTKEPDGLHGKFCVSGGQSWLKEMLVDAYERNKPDLVGFSIFAEGKTRAEKHDGKVIWMVESIDKVDSVDVVTSPAAGGRVTGLIESEEGGEVEMIESITKEELEKVRPDLVESIRKELKEASVSLSVPDADPKFVEDLKKLMAKYEVSEAHLKLKETLSKSGLPEVLKESIEKDFEDRKFEQKELDDRIVRDRDIWAKLTPPKGPVISPRARDIVGEPDKIAKAMDGMLTGKAVDGVPPFRSLHEAYAVYKGVSPFDVNPIDILSESCRGYDSSKRLVESIASGTWAEILGDSITRVMLAEYRLPALDDWRLIVSNITSPKDIRTQRRARMGGYGTLPAVAEGGTYQSLTSPTDEEVTYTPAKYGGLEDLTIETIEKDDLDAVRRIPLKLARAAKQTLYRFVFDFLATNPAIYDGVALFHLASHGNLTTVALSHAQAIVVKRMLRDQTAYGATTEFLQLVPRFLLVPNELEATARLLAEADRNPDTEVLATGGTAVAVSNRPNLMRGIQVIVVDYWTDPTDWFLVADPKLCPTMEVGFVGGQQEPEILTQSDPLLGSVFTADKISYKIRHRYGAAVLDYRPFQGAVGVA